jgi:predicted glycogen debranching enzyme
MNKKAMIKGRKKSLNSLPSIRKLSGESHDPNEGRKSEWLETNGLGGFASSTVINLNTRRYHGLLFAAVNPPTERMLLLSKLDETIIIDENKFELACNDYGTVVQPQGNQFLQSFTKELFPEFIYEAGNIKLKKTIAMKHGESTTLIIYEALKAEKEFSLELLPLIAVRDYHSLAHSNGDINRQASFENSILSIQAYDKTPEFFICIPNAEFVPQADWYFHFNYSEEKNRGLDFEEDLFTHGKFLVKMKESDILGIIVSTENPELKDALELLEEEKERRRDQEIPRCDRRIRRHRQ